MRINTTQIFSNDKKFFTEKKKNQYNQNSRLKF